MKNGKEWLKKKVIDFGNLPETYMSKTIVADVDMVNCLIDELEEPEQEKVVVPKFVGDWIDKNRDKTTLLDSKAMMFQRCIHDDLRVLDWVDDNDDLFIIAWLDGFSVEEEKQYLVRVGEKLYFIGYEETVARFVIDDAPGRIEEAYIYYNFKNATNCAKEVGGEVVEVTDNV